MTELPPDGAVVALDAVAFAYFFDRHPRYFRTCAELFRRMSTGGFQGVASSLVLSELLVPYFGTHSRGGASALAAQLRDYPNLRSVAVDEGIAFEAARLRAAYNLRAPDAVHVATALGSGAEWFVTNDRRLRRVEPEGIRVWLFDETTSTDSGSDH